MEAGACGYLGPRGPSGWAPLHSGMRVLPVAAAEWRGGRGDHGDPVPRQPHRPGWERRQRTVPACPGQEEQAPAAPEEAAAAAAEPVPAPGGLWHLRPVRVPQLRLGWCRQPRSPREARPCPAVGAAGSSDLPRLRAELLRLLQGAGEPLPCAGGAGAAAAGERRRGPGPRPPESRPCPRGKGVDFTDGAKWALEGLRDLFEASKLVVGTQQHAEELGRFLVRVRTATDPRQGISQP